MHIDEMDRREREAQEAQKAGDHRGSQAALDAFRVAHEAFIAAARTAKNYMIQAAKAAGQKAWIDQRLENPICKFFGSLANVDLHDHGIELSRSYDVNITFGAVAQHHFLGGPPDLIPTDGDVIIVMPKFCYNEADLEDHAQEAYSNVKLDLAGKPRSIIALASDYYLALLQISKNANRNSRFELARTSVSR
jgi:hypothetical protein